ncbi:MAG: type II toxin-antitoxin system antitoxin SocA domain-containing protein [bacterium]
MNTVKDILLQILSEASSQNISLGKTQLVKLLYLTEVEHYRAHGNRLTDLQWLFSHYGPYALALESIFSDSEFEKKEVKIQSDKDLILFRVAESMAAYKPKVDVSLSLIIKKIVGQWGNKPLEELLDYVYFETEPMESVKQRGDVLDFSTIKPASEIPSIIPLKASKEAEKKVAILRERIKPFLESMGQAQVTEPEPSNDYIEAIKAWDEAESSMLTIPPGFVVHITKGVSNSGNEGD